ncbi:MAG: bifunctional diaminohydroxyphosphoribosylaminopyrimidine deaminase/5-amino-6-(5-phosphoribosylamino)uracil reductase RibD, partial [Candidatus Marsarchaeota archaeon]|nr:bifunctional diaminohydroxyphosphoribosylaminopyrimidine deaminase/5-amino-6-(5-phosphoribosylamino)uracil reductase RibD [Candidatus Marsarchaeota archaeon]
VVFANRIVGEGYHHAAGRLHAEAEAIREVKRKYGSMAAHVLSASTLYVLLEPCSHQGRQPPCTKAIIDAKIPRVVFAMKDPNPKAKGGADALRKAGVKVGMAGRELEAKAKAINAPFVHHIKTGRAYVTLKMAISKDRKVTGASKDLTYISSPESLKAVQLMRDKAPAIMVGIGTIKADNPRLTCRMRGGHDPLRVIVDPHLEIDEKARVLKNKNALVVCMKKAAERKRKKLAHLRRRGIGLFFAQKESGGRLAIGENGGHLALGPLLSHLAQTGIDHVLLEGGPRLASDMLRQKLVDEIVLFHSQKIIGGENDRKLAGHIRHIMREGRANRRLSLPCGSDRAAFSVLGKGSAPFWPAFFAKEESA